MQRHALRGDGWFSDCGGLRIVAKLFDISQRICKGDDNDDDDGDDDDDDDDDDGTIFVAEELRNKLDNLWKFLKQFFI